MPDVPRDKDLLDSGDGNVLSVDIAWKKKEKGEVYVFKRRRKRSEKEK